MQLQVPKSVSWKEMDDLVIIVDTQTGEYFSLNGTASTIWGALAEGEGSEGATTAILSKYDVQKRQADTDVINCIEEWIGYGILKQSH